MKIKTLKDRWDAAKLKYLVFNRPDRADSYEVYDQGFVDGVEAVIDFLSTDHSEWNYTAYDHTGQKWRVHKDIVDDLKKELKNSEVYDLQGKH
jgi:hypothetical protein